MHHRLTVFAAAVTLAGAMTLAACSSGEGTPTPTPTPTATPVATPADPVEVDPTGYRNAEYEIEDRTVQLVDGMHEVEAAPGSSTKVVTRIFGNEATGDLNGDGLDDVAFVMTQDPGGSGTFFYIVVALRTDEGWRTTNAVLLGDRIAPQTTEIRDGVLIVNYADRAPGEPMSATPSVGMSKYLKVVDGRLVEE